MIDNKAKKILTGLTIASACVLAFLVGTRTFGFDGRYKRKPAPPELKLRELGRGAITGAKTARYASNRVLVKFRPSFSVRNIRPTLQAYGSATFTSIPQLGIYKVQVPAQASVREFLSALKRNPDVEYAEPDFQARIQITPNDKYFESQYALSNTGQVLDDLPDRPQCTAGADISATGAWDQTKGDAGVIIAVLDTGVDMKHPDIENKIASRGKDFINNDNDATDDHWHGTHVAGIVAADTNNSLGIAGVAWNCKVLPVKVADKDGMGFYSTLIEGLVWAADQNVQVINMSMGGEEAADSLRSAVKYVYDKNVVIVASAGNEGNYVLYPAAYDDYCLAVAATNYNDEVTTWSNAGPQVDVAAPGVDILSLYPTWDTPSGFAPYAYASGTSMATPHVAGFAALIKSLKPWLTVSQVMNVIRYSSDDVNADKFPGKDDHIGYGRINMERALVPYKLNSSK
jgi:subtilisin family serine protease